MASPARSKANYGGVPASVRSQNRSGSKEGRVYGE